jgi:hypothetical protein
MSDATRAYLGSWPEFYDRLLVPVLFEPYARLLAGRLQGMTSGNVLEIAAGTGVVTRELIRTLPEAVGITATDLNQPCSTVRNLMLGRNASGGNRPMHSRNEPCVFVEFSRGNDYYAGDHGD